METDQTNRSGNTYLPLSTIERPRLQHILKGILNHKLTIITAPAGYGKTTLFSQVVHQLTAPVVWQTIEPRDCDIPILFENTLVALAAITPGIQNLKLPRQRSSPSELVIEITDYLRPQLIEDIVYLLDDVHHFVGTPAGDKWLQTLVTNVPAKCHLVVISRVLPNLPLTEMIARRDVLAIGQSQLKFTSEEINQLAQVSNIVLTPSDFQRLTLRLGGWPAGVILALHPLSNEFEQTVFDGQPGPETLFYRLAHHLLQSQPPLLRKFLLASSTLRRMTPELCEHILQLPNSAAYLTQIQQRNLFLSQTSDGFVYHDLFREFLQTEFQAWNTNEFIHLHTQAGQWFENHNRPDEAFQHFVVAKLWGAAATIAQRVAQTYFAQGKLEIVLNWNNQLKDIDIPIPRLRYTVAMIYTDRYQYDLALLEIAKAEEGFQILGDNVGLFEIELLQGTIENQTGKYHQATERSHQLLSQSALPSNLQGYALLILGYATLQLGDSQTALQHFENALPLYRAVNDVYATLGLLHNLELTHLRLGQFDEAGQYLQEIVATYRTSGRGMSFALALNDLGYYHHQMGKYEEAFQEFQEGLSIVRRISEKRVESGLLWSLGDLQRDRGVFEEAYQIYTRSLELIGNSDPALRCGVLNSLAVLCRWQQKYDEACNVANEALTIANQSNLVLEQLKSVLNLYAAQIQDDNCALAEQKLSEVATQLLQKSAYARCAQAWGLCAYLALLQKNNVKATQYVELITTTIVHANNLQPVLAEIQHIPLLSEFIQQHMSRHTHIIEGIRGIAAAQIPTVPELPVNLSFGSQIFSLRVWTLGQEKIECDGTPIRPSAWRRTSRKLFFYLLLRGPTTREQLGLDFWEDASNRQVRRNFHTTLHRARQALGENAILFQDDIYMINTSLDFWCDAYELESLVEQAKLLSPRTPQAEYLWTRASELYRGDFLPELDFEWADAYRELLRERYLEALIGLGNCARARHDFQGAVTIFKRALSHDAYREDVHRLIMTCYAEQGEPTQVQKYYAELQQFMSDELAIEPSRETRALVQTLSI